MPVSQPAPPQVRFVGVDALPKGGAAFFFLGRAGAGGGGQSGFSLPLCASRGGLVCLCAPSWLVVWCVLGCPRPPRLVPVVLCGGVRGVLQFGVGRVSPDLSLGVRGPLLAGLAPPCRAVSCFGVWHGVVRCSFVCSGGVLCVLCCGQGIPVLSRWVPLLGSGCSSIACAFWCLQTPVSSVMCCPCAQETVAPATVAKPMQTTPGPT